MEPLAHILYSLVITACVVYIHYRTSEQIDSEVAILRMQVESVQESVYYNRDEIEQLQEEYENIQLNTMALKSKATRGELQSLEHDLSGSKDLLQKDINILAKRITVLENAAAGYQVVDERLSKLEERNKPGAWVPVNWFK